MACSACLLGSQLFAQNSKWTLSHQKKGHLAKLFVSNRVLTRVLVRREVRSSLFCSAAFDVETNNLTWHLEDKKTEGRREFPLERSHIACAFLHKESRRGAVLQAPVPSALMKQFSCQ